MPSEVLPRFIDDDYLPEEDEPTKIKQPEVVEEDEAGFWASKKTAIICAIIIVIILILVIIYIVYTQKKKNVHKSNTYSPVSINPRRPPRRTPDTRALPRPKQRPQQPKKKVHFEDEEEDEEEEIHAESSGDEKNKMIEEMNMDHDDDFEDTQSRKDDELVMDKFMEDSMEVSDNIELNDILQQHDNEDELSDDNYTPAETSSQCAFVPSTGKNKGIRCDGIVINGSVYCTKHKYAKK